MKFRQSVLRWLWALLIGVAALAAHASPLADAEAFVRSVYAGYERPRPPAYLGAQARNVFSPALLALIRVDQARAQGEVGALDYDPLCSCQDITLSGLDIRGRALGAQRARFVVRFDNAGTPTRIVLNLVRLSDGEWRIADVHSDQTPSLEGFLMNAARSSAPLPRR